MPRRYGGGVRPPPGSEPLSTRERGVPVLDVEGTSHRVIAPAAPSRPDPGAPPRTPLLKRRRG
ncbi:hypothetical protein ACIF9R_09655 [Streptomyces sp. NPDC086080]|uniref:hypothetical protein n=1 Tax=Streptomyces sp. NPDC086080 TaxID=3365748 RepID=UPI0037D0F09A